MVDLPHIFNVKDFPPNREYMRRLEQEIKRVNDQLLPVEFDFVVSLFNPEYEGVPYQEHYDHYHSLWRERILRINRIGKPLKLVTINEDFFSQMFAPVVK